MTASKTLRLVFAAALAATLTSSWAQAGGAPAAEAEDGARRAAAFIATLGAELQAIQEETAAHGAEARPAALRRLIRKGFDLDLTSQLVLGKYWVRASAVQRRKFRELFAEYLIRSYARHLDVYRVETLAIVASHPAGPSDFLVETRVEGDSDAANPVWRLRAQDGGMRIIDVHIDGISLALTQRSEFASVIRQGGFDGLLAVLRQRVSGQTEVAGESVHEALPAGLLTSPNVGKIDLLLRQQ